MSLAVSTLFKPLHCPLLHPALEARQSVLPGLLLQAARRQLRKSARLGGGGRVGGGRRQVRGGRHPVPSHPCMRCRRSLIIAGRGCGGGRLGLDDGGHPRRVRLPPHVLCVRQLVVFLVFHSPVLKPDLYLPLRQCKSMCNLNSAPACQVTVEVELLQQKKNFENFVQKIFEVFTFSNSSIWCLV